MPDDALLTVRDLHVRFYTYSGEVQAIAGVGFDLNRTGTLGLVGETGCGKSVTAMSILRILPAKTAEIVRGSICYDGVDLLKLPEREMQKVRGKQISMVFQDPQTSLNPTMKIGDQIREAIRLHWNTNRKAMQKRVLEALQSVELPDQERIAKSYPIQLSGGMAQRCMIAMAMSCDPSLLILDEPTTALDVTIQAQIFDLLRHLQSRTGLTLLLITHDLGAVWDMCDDVAVMYAGNVVEIAARSRIFMENYHPYTKALLGALPDIADVGAPLRTLPGNVPNLVEPPSGCRFHPRCPCAMDICGREIPRLRYVEERHAVACHLA